ncbi:MAG: LVIVD repeat-containing protein, partial [Cenarchaeum symbiont of Oopsacas minuta]|nr:LVIVD repeat-containing protein [Cenarchaeum symbiont of Oopsacas minuta]
MYIAVILLLVLLSPLPFISPFEYNVQSILAQEFSSPPPQNSTNKSTTQIITTIDADPITVTSLTIASNGNGNIHAREGQNVTVTLTTDGTDLGNVTGAILGRAFTTVANANGFATFTNLVESGDNGNATFSITVTNSSGNQITITQDDITDDTFVTTDTINPEITLNGLNNTIIILNAPYVDPGAIATDASYGTRIVQPSSDPVDTNTLGTYTLSYTAPDDPAGNPGSTITRTVSVQDIPPIILSNIQYELGVSPVAKITDTEHLVLDAARSIAITQIDGNTYALVAASTDHGIQIIDITNPASPSPIANVTDGTTYPVLSGAQGITTIQIDGYTYALVAAFNDDGVQIVNITNPADPSPIASITDGTDYPRLNGASGITAIQIDGYTYALVAAIVDNGVQIINISNPASPSPVADITDSTGGYSELRGARDITTTKIDGYAYALVAANNDDGVQIINISNPASPSPTAAIADNIGGYSRLDEARSITTTKIDGSTYALVAAYRDDGVQIIDISNPASPSPIASITDSTDYPRLNGAVHVTTTQIDGYTYALVASQLDNGIQIINITNPADPSPVTAITDSAEYPELLGAYSTATTKINDVTYALATAISDDGVQIIKFEVVPIETTPISIKSSRGNTYANIGDTLTIELSINDTIDSYTANIINIQSTPTVTTNNDSLVVSVTIPSIQIEEHVTFSITVANSLGASLVITQDDLLSNIFVDTVSPRISLLFSANYTILQNTTDTIVPGATATDGDPKYSGTYSSIRNGTLDTSILGAVLIYTYTASTDKAGNLGESINRTVTIVDAEPITVTGLTVSSTSVNNYARAGQTVSITLTTDGADLGNVTGRILDRAFTTVSNAGGSATFTNLVESGDNGNATFSITVTNSSGNKITVTQDDITDDSFVTLDTIKPVITLNGVNNTIVIQNSTYTDAGAKATDASYGTQTITGTGTVNTNTLGTYTLSYKAPDD